MKSSQSTASRVAIVGVLAAIALAPMGEAYADDVGDANATVALFKKTDSNLGRFFDGAVGYAVFPSVGKGGMGIGGAYGSGVLCQGGKPVGKTTLTQVTIGFQLGGQAYSEIIFFESEKVLSDFKAGNFAFSGQASAVALTSGASANANYRMGVAVFTAAKGGLMFEASIGGQKFSYEPFGRKK
jgi:lipid-binding SYLF domain-containing protein